MLKGLIAVVLLPFLASAAVADTTGRAEIQRAASVADADGSDVRRAKTEHIVTGGTLLAPASVQDVDTNRDGKISFEELLAHDLNSDF